MAKVLRHILAVLCLLAAVFFLLPSLIAASRPYSS